MISPDQAAKELLRRRKARKSIKDFAMSIDIPGAPITDEDDEDIFIPVDEAMAAHHIMICDVMQGLIEGTIKHEGETVRGAMLFLPPGSAKSTYANVVTPAWAVGKFPGYNIITTSYNTPLALKQSRKTRQIIKSEKYSRIFDASLSRDNSAVEDYSLTNQSTMRAAGILAGITGNRADGIIIDDPIKGREEADSESMRKKTKEAIDDDLMTRMKPYAWVCYILTRWHEDDPAGRLLPDDWNGETGFFRGTDGELYYVLCIPAQCESNNDPLGREIGEYIWPEWFPENHWNRFKSNPRTWSALYQQRPQPDSGTYFKREWFKRYDLAPITVNKYMTSDYAVSEGKGDYTEHTMFGVNPNSDIYILENWHGQTEADVWIDEALGMIRRHKPYVMFGEGGVIKNAVQPFLKKAMQQQQTYCRIEWINPIGDKPSRARAFQAMASMGKVYIPRGEAGDRMLDQLIRFPTGKNDDFVDTCSLIGLVIDNAHEAYIKNSNNNENELHPLSFKNMMRSGSSNRKRI